ncbi:histidine phosphatase family protein [Clostridium sp. Sa3CUN1]|uniref:Histidine phosphatase family protein n=1 Tax=Clostridium gallinarum TaxID=2762246 RepID=A0ABR8PZC3_9CLOT|nr:histidine phosphatase family protein [Clostridium gallinarum]
MSSIIIYLIRHGKTIANERKLYCGKTDLPLSDIGIREIEKLKSEINYPSCERYFTSGAKRANETFNILYENEKYIELKGFFEYDFGDFEMKSYEELKENKNYIKWIMDEEGNVSCPNGESKNTYKKRIKEEFKAFINTVRKENLKEVLVVSHGGTIGTILEEFYDNSKNFYSWQPRCGEGYKIIVEILEDNFKINKVIELKKKS